MELREFVAETLLAIQEGVADAIRRADESKTLGRINPVWEGGADEKVDWKEYVQPVEFDVAVTTTTKSEAEGKGSVKVLSVVELGAEGSKSREHSRVSRIKFSIPISAPAHRTDRYPK
jgi:Trypsin-co-occurring domain 2